MGDVDERINIPDPKSAVKNKLSIPESQKLDYKDELKPA